MTFVRQRAAEGALLAGNRQEVMGESESLHSMAWCCWLPATAGISWPRCLPAQVVQWSRSPNESRRHVRLSAARLCHQLLMVYTCLSLCFSFTHMHWFCFLCSNFVMLQIVLLLWESVSRWRKEGWGLVSFYSRHQARRPAVQKFCYPLTFKRAVS